MLLRTLSQALYVPVRADTSDEDSELPRLKTKQNKKPGKLQGEGGSIARAVELGIDVTADHCWGSSQVVGGCSKWASRVASVRCPCWGGDSKWQQLACIPGWGAEGSGILQSGAAHVLV